MLMRRIDGPNQTEILRHTRSGCRGCFLLIGLEGTAVLAMYCAPYRGGSAETLQAPDDDDS